MKEKRYILFLDNVRIHSSRDIDEMSTRYGITYKFLSLYSYMLKQLEKVFLKIKSIVKRNIKNRQEDGNLSTFTLNACQQV